MNRTSTRGTGWAVLAVGVALPGLLMGCAGVRTAAPPGGTPPTSAPSATSPAPTASPTAPPAVSPTAPPAVSPSAPPAVALPDVAVVRCPTAYGDPAEQANASPPPPVVSVPGLPPGARVWAYAGAFVVVGPAGWDCQSTLAEDGNQWVLLYPPGTSEPQFRSPFVRQPQQGITAYLPSEGTRAPYDMACTLFPAARPGSLVCGTRPAGETVQQVSATVVDFEDPPGVTGDGFPSGGSYTARGVMYYQPQNAQSAAGASATCTLPDSEAAVCTAILADFLQRYA
jgi:hypothetical protein